MDERTKETWLDVATVVFVATTGGFTAGSFRSLCRRAIARHDATGRLDPDAWATAGSAAMRHQSGGTASDRGASTVRSILSGLAVATGDFAAVPVADRAELAAMLRDAPFLANADAHADAILAAPAPPSPAPMAAPATVQAAYPCFTGNGSGTAWLGRRDVAVAAVDPADAPVACRLRTAAGNVLDLRVHDGRYYRPVLAPGSWEQLDVAGFAEAAKGMVPWVDSPFAQGDVLGRVAAAVVDCALDVRVSTPARKAVVEATAATAAARHGRFLAIDGVVYRATGAPSLVVMCDGDFLRDNGRNHLVVAWALEGDLDSTSDLRTLSRVRTTGLPYRFMVGTHGDKVATARLWTAGTFAVADAGHARGFADMLVGLGPTCGTVSAYVLDASRIDAFAVEVVDAALLPPPSAHPWLDATVAMLRDLDTVGARYEGVGPDAIPRATLDLAGEAIGGRVGMDEACDGLAAAVARLVQADPAVDTARLMAGICGRAVDEMRELYDPALATFVA